MFAAGERGTVEEGVVVSAGIVVDGGGAVAVPSVRSRFGPESQNHSSVSTSRKFASHDCSRARVRPWKYAVFHVFVKRTRLIHAGPASRAWPVFSWTYVMRSGMGRA